MSNLNPRFQGPIELSKDELEAIKSRLASFIIGQVSDLEGSENYRTDGAALLDHLKILRVRDHKLVQENTRLFPLVRFQRQELHEAKLITDREYADLNARGGSYILDTYDEMRGQISKAETRANQAEAELNNQRSLTLKLTEELSEAQDQVKVLKEHIRQLDGSFTARERLENQINEAENNFGYGFFQDGRNQERLEKLKVELQDLGPDPGLLADISAPAPIAETTAGVLDLEPEVVKAWAKHDSTKPYLVRGEARALEAEAELERMRVVVTQQKAMIGALDLIRAGYLKKTMAATKLLMGFDEYETADAFLKTMAADDQPVVITNSTSEWIPTTERLPAPAERVLVATKCGSVESAYFLLVDDRGRENQMVQGSGHTLATDFTHWMPMPAGPVKVEGSKPNA